jgi:hypothetical protein
LLEARVDASTEQRDFRDRLQALFWISSMYNDMTNQIPYLKVHWAEADRQ